MKKEPLPPPMMPVIAARRLLVLAALAVCAAGLAGCARTKQPLELSRPDVLLLVIDCLRFDHVGVNGYSRPTTPAIDALAEEGISFTQAISPSSWTRPSMPSLLTGLYPSEHGLIELERNEAGAVIGPIMDPEIDTLAEKLAAAGYGTALIGEQFQLSHRFGLAQGFDLYKNQIGGAERIHERFFDWLEETEPERYFSLLHYFDIHWPYCPPPSVRGTFDPGGGAIDFCSRTRKLRQEIRRGDVTLDDADLQTLIALYDEELLTLDRTLGEFFQVLRERGLWDKLMIVITSDHGEEFLEHGSIGHKNSLYDELIRVPVIIKPPADWPVERGISSDALIESRDIVATVEAAAGLAPTTSSRSLLPWLGLPGEREPREVAVSESHAFLAARTPRWKLIVSRDDGSEVLYDLESDPGETVDAAGENPEEVSRLRGHLGRWRSELVETNPSRMTIDEKTTKGLRAIGYLD